MSLAQKLKLKIKVNHVRLVYFAFELHSLVAMCSYSLTLIQLCFRIRLVRIGVSESQGVGVFLKESDSEERWEL